VKCLFYSTPNESPLETPNIGACGKIKVVCKAKVD